MLILLVVPPTARFVTSAAGVGEGYAGSVSVAFDSAKKLTGKPAIPMKFVTSRLPLVIAMRPMPPLLVIVFANTCPPARIFNVPVVRAATGPVAAGGT